VFLKQKSLCFKDGEGANAQLGMRRLLR